MSISDASVSPMSRAVRHVDLVDVRIVVVRCLDRGTEAAVAVGVLARRRVRGIHVRVVIRVDGEGLIDRRVGDQVRRRVDDGRRLAACVLSPGAIGCPAASAGSVRVRCSARRRSGRRSPDRSRNREPADQSEPADQAHTDGCDPSPAYPRGRGATMNLLYAKTSRFADFRCVPSRLSNRLAGIQQPTGDVRTTAPSAKQGSTSNFFTRRSSCSGVEASMDEDIPHHPNSTGQPRAARRARLQRPGAEADPVTPRRRRRRG